MVYRNTLTTVLIFLLVAFQVKAQECGGQRYIDEIFTVDVTTGIKFGEGIQPNLINPNATQELFFDIYQPGGDTLARRPLIIWAFGGGFVFGTRVSPDIVSLSNAFAKRGYVNASIDYRLSPDLVFNSDPANAYEAIMKGSHDMAAAIRFFYKDAATVDAYRIDTTRIFIGGVSAGAFSALHAVHIDELNEIPTEIYNLFIDNGSFEGNSGNPGYSRDVAGVINLCGALGDTAWIDPIGIPIVSVHGDNDGVVPYGSQINTLFGVNLMTHGSGSIHAKLDQLGTENALHTFHGEGHTPFVLSAPHMDTTVWFVRDFLYDHVCQAATPLEDELPDKDFLINIFPNPNNGQFMIEIDGTVGTTLKMDLLDHLGREILSSQKVTNGVNNLNISGVAPGVYTIRFKERGADRPVFRRMLIQ